MQQAPNYQDYLSREHLAKALEAEALAEQSKDLQIRRGWLKLAECYRELARETAHNRQH